MRLSIITSSLLHWLQLPAPRGVPKLYGATFGRRTLEPKIEISNHPSVAVTTIVFSDLKYGSVPVEASEPTVVTSKELMVVRHGNLSKYSRYVPVKVAGVDHTLKLAMIIDKLNGTLKSSAYLFDGHDNICTKFLLTGVSHAEAAISNGNGRAVGLVRRH